MKKTIFCLVIFVILLGVTISEAQIDFPVISPENAHELVAVSQLGNGRPSSFTWSIDGNLLAVAEARGFRLFNLDGELMQTYASEYGRVRSLVFSTDGKLLAAGFENGDIIIFEADTLNPIQTLIGHARPVITLAFDSSGTRLLSGSGADLPEDRIWLFDNDIARLWDIQTGEILKTFGASGIRKVAFSGDSIAILSAQKGDRRIGYGYYADHFAFARYDRETYELQQEINNYPPDLTNQATDINYLRYELAISPDHHWVALPGDPDILIWDNINNQEIIRLKAGEQNYRFLDATFTLDSAQLIILAEDEMGQSHLLRWSTSDWQLLDDKVSPFYISQLELNPQGDKLAVLQGNDQVRVLTLPHYAELFQIDDYSGKITDLTFTADGTQLIVGETYPSTSTGHIRAWRDGESQNIYSGSGVAKLAIARTSDTLVSWHEDGLFRIWDNILDKEPLTWGLEYQNPEFQPQFALSPDGQWLTVEYDSGRFKIIETHSGEEVASTASPETIMNYHPDGLLLQRSSPIVFGVNADLEPFQYDWVEESSLNDNLDHMVIDQQGRFIAFSKDKQFITLWDASSRFPAMRIKSSVLANFLSSVPLILTDMGFSPDGKILAIGTYEGLVHLVDTTSGEELAILQIETGWVTALGFSPDGQQIAVGDSSGLVTIWKIAES